MPISRGLTSKKTYRVDKFTKVLQTKVSRPTGKFKKVPMDIDKIRTSLTNANS